MGASGSASASSPCSPSLSSPEARVSALLLSSPPAGEIKLQMTQLYGDHLMTTAGAGAGAVNSNINDSDSSYPTTGTSAASGATADLLASIDLLLVQGRREDAVAIAVRGRQVGLSPLDG